MPGVPSAAVCRYGRRAYFFGARLALALRYDDDLGKVKVWGGIMELEQLRRVARARPERWMIVKGEVLLSLIARGDARQLSYQTRIEDLELELGAIKARELCAHPEKQPALEDGGLVPILEVVKETGVCRRTIERLVRERIVRGHKLPAPASNGRMYPMMHVDVDALRWYATLSMRERRKVFAGDLRVPMTGGL